MDKKYKFITIREVAQKPKTKVFSVTNNSSGVCIGGIAWYGPWRQYCFMPFSDTVYSVGCLADIQSFIQGIKEDKPNE